VSWTLLSAATTRPEIVSNTTMRGGMRSNEQAVIGFI